MPNKVPKCLSSSATLHTEAMEKLLRQVKVQVSTIGNLTKPLLNLVLYEAKEQPPVRSVFRWAQFERLNGMNAKPQLVVCVMDILHSALLDTASAYKGARYGMPEGVDHRGRGDQIHLMDDSL